MTEIYLHIWCGHAWPIILHGPVYYVKSQGLRVRCRYGCQIRVPGAAAAASPTVRCTAHMSRQVQQTARVLFFRVLSPCPASPCGVLLTCLFITTTTISPYHHHHIIITIIFILTTTTCRNIYLSRCMMVASPWLARVVLRRTAEPSRTSAGIRDANWDSAHTSKLSGDTATDTAEMTG